MVKGALPILAESGFLAVAILVPSVRSFGAGVRLKRAHEPTPDRWTKTGPEEGATVAAPVAYAASSLAALIRLRQVRLNGRGS
jgi:hypothetical protein